MKFKNIIIFCTLVSFCIIITTSSVVAIENDTADTQKINENNIDELELTDDKEVLSDVNSTETLDSKEINGYLYDNQLEIQAQDTIITNFAEQDITVKVKNIDHDPENKWSMEYPAILNITFTVFKDGKQITNFYKLTGAYGDIKFSSSILPSQPGTYTIIAKYSGKDKKFGYTYEDQHTEWYYEYLPAEKTFTITKIAPVHEWTITGKWKGQKYSVTIRLTENQYQTLKAAKNNKKLKEIGPIHTKQYITVKIKKTKKLVIYKIIKNKKTGKIKEKWTKKWKLKAKKLIKQGYKSKLLKKLSKKNGKIWITFKKTYKKKYEIKATVSTIAKNGQYKKGDYITLYSAEPMTAKKITI